MNVLTPIEELYQQRIKPLSVGDRMQLVKLITQDITQEETSSDEREWDTLMQLLADSQVETGIPDLAEQHDHYLYGKPKTR